MPKENYKQQSRQKILIKTM